MNRRNYLATASATVSGLALAGCSGNGGGSDSTSTDTEQRFSTEGNDSDRFDLSEEETENLVLTASDLPGSGWEKSGPNGYTRETEQGNRVLAGTMVYIEESVSEAQTRYEEINSLLNFGLTGEVAEPDQTQELGIGVESRWEVATGTGEDEVENEFSAGTVIFRDANAIGTPVITVVGNADSDLVSLDTMGELGVTLHQKLR